MIQTESEPEMQNLDLTKWLEMVWRALKERDQVKRNRLLDAADLFLQKNNLADSALPGVERQKTAA